MKSKFYLVVLGLIALVAIGSMACSGEKSETENESVMKLATNSILKEDGTPKEDVLAMAAPQAKLIEVYNISNIAARGDKSVFPDFEWTQDGKVVKFSEFAKNKVVFMNFWTTWCGPCKKEIPDIIEMTDELEGKDVVIMGVSVDRGDKSSTLNKVSKFVNAKGINYIIFHAPELGEAIGGVRSVPTTLVLKKDHTLGEQIVGMRSKSEFMKAIERAM